MMSTTRIRYTPGCPCCDTGQRLHIDVILTPYSQSLSFNPSGDYSILDAGGNLIDQGPLSSVVVDCEPYNFADGTPSGWTACTYTLSADSPTAVQRGSTLRVRVDVLGCTYDVVTTTSTLTTSHTWYVQVVPCTPNGPYPDTLYYSSQGTIPGGPPDFLNPPPLVPYTTTATLQRATTANTTLLDQSDGLWCGSYAYPRWQGGPQDTYFMGLMLTGGCTWSLLAAETTVPGQINPPQNCTDYLDQFRGTITQLTTWDFNCDPFFFRTGPAGVGRETTVHG